MAAPTGPELKGGLKALSVQSPLPLVVEAPPLLQLRLCALLECSSSPSSLKSAHIALNSNACYSPLLDLRTSSSQQISANGPIAHEAVACTLATPRAFHDRVEFIAPSLFERSRASTFFNVTFPFISRCVDGRGHKNWSRSRRRS